MPSKWKRGRATPEELKARIDAMTREQMAAKWRFARVGDPLFQGGVGVYFKERFDSLGGMSPSISKALGWDR